ncbi:MAG: hypothetical protein JRI68_04740 [Deltaproteobacteria bacterium]|nr:hypothetical protein [Deltaproteobacteria bacterium]
MRCPVVLACALLVGCGEGDPALSAPARVRLDFDHPGGFFDAPFPSDHRLAADGTVDMSGYPNPDDIPFVSAMLTLLDGEADGFGQSSGVFFATTAAVDETTLPTLHQSVESDATVFLVGIDPSSPDYLERTPVTVQFTADAGPFGDANLLSLVPLQGIPMRSRTRYAAVVTTGVTDGTGLPLAQPEPLKSLISGEPPVGMSDAAAETYQAALDGLAALGLGLDRIAAVAAFTTWDATSGMTALVDHARTLPTPQPLSGWTQTDLFDEYCVYQTTLEMPVYQQGDPPYSDGGGGITFEGGEPVFDRHEEARVVVTVPRATMPTGGWPTALMVRTGGGGDRPLVDRGVRDEDGEVAVPGSGPALHFTRAGYAGVTVDGPHGGIRNITGDDEQFLMFNIGNPAAMRDNIRQSALELALMVDVIEELTLDVSDCPDGDPAASFDTGTLAIMGHSMGATISPLTLATEPRYGAAILSGAGGSWIENVVHKQSPVAIRPLAEVLLNYLTHQRQLHEHDPVLTLLQWAGEPADPPLFARAITREADAPRHVLMLQGIVDTYILPPIANATSLSLGLDLACEALDAGHGELADYRPLEELLVYSGAEAIALPASGNLAGTTAVVIQHAEGPVEDGHEVMFQTEPPKHQYRCFLESLRSGTPTVPVGASEDGPCAP